MMERQRTESYMIYETDCLCAIGRVLGAEIDRRFYDILHPAAEETKSADEIIDERLARFGIKVVD